jgi:hypothetical protein
MSGGERAELQLGRRKLRPVESCAVGRVCKLVEAGGRYRSNSHHTVQPTPSRLCASTHSGAASASSASFDAVHRMWLIQPHSAFVGPSSRALPLLSCAAEIAIVDSSRSVVSSAVNPLDVDQRDARGQARTG